MEQILSLFIRKRNNNYNVICEYRTSSGERKQKSLGKYSSQRQAEKQLTIEKSKLYNNNFNLPARLTLGTYLEEWHASRKDKLEITTWNRNTLIINHVNRLIGHINIQDIKPLTISTMYSNLYKANDDSKSLSNKTKLQYHRVLSKAFRDAYIGELIPKNIMELVEAPKPIQKEAKYLDVEEALKLLQGIKGSRYEIPVNLALALGLRASEICGLSWDKVNFKDNIIRIDTVAVWDEVGKKVIFKPTKTMKSTRTLVIPQGLRSILIDWKETQKDTIPSNEFNLVFTKEDGAPSCSHIFGTAYKNFIRRKKFNIGFHELRHSYASLQLRAGSDIKVISETLGHSQIGISMNLYTHVIQSLKDEASSNINNILYK